ncbi:dihydrofolate synthase/folylpolyglutamate synthase [Antricoccus suffuscus]|uniref:Dihydrofolate synthase/folylpolyglutamate synthase n=1 Tax=Antricoccus suffuscus TaxID=1629062 RepID=A0A2T0ZVP6_9ACTN|nr:folylpolyglutamate synthase/dihydrofolate synthase family protein [Antricoccus suffuscus]PRZ40403.1 dihydrofolate synthase/folylpolyglutamate synthase [Antricoccus suffuscus]
MSEDQLSAAEVEAQLLARWPETRIEPSLVRMQSLMELMGSPQKTFPVVHITGTNGKTSTARMIDDLFRSFGLRTGRFTSPHLSTVRERICFDGEPIDERRFVEIYEEVAPYLELVDAGHGVPDEAQQVPVSFFEAITTMAYAAFSDAPVDIAIVEVGLGGRWDATNVADGKIAVVTPIGMDHAHLLGDTLAKIAGEKSGIIKPGSSAILAAQETDVATVLLTRATEVGAIVAREGVEFGVADRQIAVGGQMLSIQGIGGRYDNLLFNLFGAHQAQNAAVALAAVEAFFGSGAEGPLNGELVQEAFAAMSAPGRLEIVRTSPTIMVDAAHNPHGMSASVAAINESFDFSRLVGVFAASSDKDIAGMLDLLEPILDEIVVTRNNNSRSSDIDGLARIAVEYFGSDRVTVETRLPEAIETAVRLTEEGEHLSGSGVLITGSVFTAGDARILLKSDRKKPWEEPL